MCTEHLNGKNLPISENRFLVGLGFYFVQALAKNARGEKLVCIIGRLKTVDKDCAK